jgi:hypothetical protein
LIKNAPEESPRNFDAPSRAHSDAVSGLEGSAAASASFRGTLKTIVTTNIPTTWSTPAREHHHGSRLAPTQDGHDRERCSR